MWQRPGSAGQRTFDPLKLGYETKQIVARAWPRHGMTWVSPGADPDAPALLLNLFLVPSESKRYGLSSS